MELTYTAIIAIAKLGLRALGQRMTMTGLERLPAPGAPRLDAEEKAARAARRAAPEST